MPPINLLTAIPVVVGFLMVLSAYWPLAHAPRAAWARYVVRASVIAAAVVVARTLYWDVAEHLVGVRWDGIRQALGGQQFSALFNVALYPVVYLMLHSRLQIVPQQERAHWRWWDVWAYPHGIPGTRRYRKTRGLSDD